MKYFLRITCCLILLSFSNSIKAQLAGSYNVPATYTSIAAAISDLNTLGISGSVTINIAAGYTETAPSGGYTLTATGNSTASIVFQKSGIGTNPLITAFTTGTNTPSSAAQNGIWRMIGSDYITIDGIDLYDPNTTNPATMEFGYGLFKASATNGCQYNTIKNCTVTLSRVNNATGSGPAADGSRGIDVVNALTGSHTTNVTVTSVGGTNSYNKFYSNTIQNCNIGIALIGFTATTPFTNGDQFNDVGGSSSATGNIIINYGGAVGATNPAAGIRTLNQWNFNASYNLINNNNGSGTGHPVTLRGIFLNTATSANATVSNNTITVKSIGTTAQLTGIENLAGATAASNTIAITNNLITNCTYTSATSGVFYGIYSSASCDVLQVTGNTIANNSSNAASGSYYPIYQANNVASQLNISMNSIANNSLTATTTSAIFRGIYNTFSAATSTLSINSNSLQNVVYGGTASGACDFIYNSANSSSVTIMGNAIVTMTIPNTGGTYFIYNSNTTPNSTISNNTIGSVTKTGAGSPFYGYYNSGNPTTGTTTINNNNISNVSISSGSNFYGLYQITTVNQVQIVTTNTVSNLNASSGTMAGILHGDGAVGSSVNNNLVANFNTMASINGLQLGNISGNGMSVYSNTIHSLSGNGTQINGIFYTSGNNTSIYKNRIYNLSAITAGGFVYGMNLQASTASNTLNVYNNLVGDLKAPIASNANAINGIYVNCTAANANINVSYNSVYINAASTGVTFGTSGLYHTSNATATTGQLTIRNNIIVNASTPNGTGLTVAFRRSAATQANYNTASNTNIFYGGIPGNSNLLYYDGTNSIQTISSFKTLVSPREISSATEFPPFVSIVGSAPNFLDLNTTTPTQAESAATPISGITDDYSGTIRNVTTPDIGAWEGNYTPADLTAPAITAVAYASAACNLSTRTVTANISDVSGTATGSLAPRCYYKINASAYTSVAGTLTSGTINNGVWTFVLTYAASVGDVISHYITAQDISPAANIGAVPSAGFSATDVNNIIAPPNTPSTFTVTGTLNGLYTVGAAGTFSTLTAAALAYNTWCITGPVTFELISTTYSTSTGEVFPVTFTNTPYASATNSLLIRPATGVAAVITGAAASAAVIKFQNAQFITMNGVNSGGSSLSVSNGNTGTSAAIWLASTAATGPGCKTLEFNNLNLRGNSITVASNYGIVASVDGASPATTGGMDNDNIKIQNNTFVRMGNAIYATGTTSLSAGGADNWAISTNTIGPAVFTTSLNLNAAGISLSGVVNAAIANNYVQNITTTGSGIAGIDLSTNVNTVTVSQNTVSTIAASGATSGLNSICGLFLGSGTGVSVRQNVFTTIANNTSGAGARGIIISAATASANAVFENNFIGDVYCYAGTTAATWPVGIAVEGNSGNITFDNNSVSLSGSHAAGTGTTSAVSFYMNATGGNIRLRNTILSNTYDNPNSTTDRVYAIYSAVPASNFSAINYNDYYVGGAAASPILGFISATNQMNLAAIQASFGSNLNSQNILPVFMSATDLHLDPINNAPLDNLAAPLANITLDIDNQSRSISAPDIGADEYTAPACSSASGGTQGTNSFTACSGQTLNLSSAGASAGAGIVYQWQVSPTSGGPYSNVSGGSGANTTNYTTGTLSAGTYYYVLQTTCTSASLTGISNEATVTINPIPTASITSNAPVCVGQTLNLTGGTNVGTSYQWMGPSAYTSTLQNPAITNVQLTAAGNYTFIASVGSCSSSVVSAISINGLPTAIAVCGPSVTCSGGTTTLSASGGPVAFTWTGPGAYAANTQNPILAALTPSSSGQYTLVVTGANGCTNTAVTSLTVNPNPTVTAVSSSSAICAGTSATLTASGASSYTWSSGAMTVSTVESPTVNTTYTVTGDNLGCTGQTTLALIVNPVPTVSAISSTSLLCTGSSATLTASGAVSYTWSSGTMSATTVESPTATIVYTVTGEDANGCMSTALITQSVSACAGVSATLSGRPVFTLYPNPSSGQINVILDGPTVSANLEIMDAAGKIVMKRKLHAGKSLIDISGLQSGIYFYLVKEDSKIMYSGKLLKE
jgi:trimeric autotransporter adhesin